jgi:hypothetical protein
MLVQTLFLMMAFFKLKLPLPVRYCIEPPKDRILPIAFLPTTLRRLHWNIGYVVS